MCSCFCVFVVMCPPTQLVPAYALVQSFFIKPALSSHDFLFLAAPALSFFLPIASRPTFLPPRIFFFTVFPSPLPFGTDRPWFRVLLRPSLTRFCFSLNFSPLTFPQSMSSLDTFHPPFLLFSLPSVSATFTLPTILSPLYVLSPLCLSAFSFFLLLSAPRV